MSTKSKAVSARKAKLAPRYEKVSFSDIDWSVFDGPVAGLEARVLEAVQRYAKNLTPEILPTLDLETEQGYEYGYACFRVHVHGQRRLSDAEVLKAIEKEKEDAAERRAKAARTRAELLPKLLRERADLDAQIQRLTKGKKESK